VATRGIEDLKLVYLIFGEESLLLERALHRLRDRVAEVADLDFNFDVFDGETADAEAIAAAANTLPFASERRLVVVRNVDKMNAAAQARLADYAKDPAPTACVVFVAAKVPKNSRLYRAVDATGVTAEYKPPKRSEYPAWVQELLASKGRRITRDAAEALVRAAGRDLRRLEIEAEKLIAFAGERTELVLGDVEAAVAQTASTSVFDFLNALGARDCALAFRLLANLMRDGQEILAVHAMTLRHIRMLASVQALVRRGENRAAIAREVGMADWQLRNALDQAERYSSDELTHALRSAAECEARMKSGRGEPEIVFERWVVEVCRRS
jgi:DNA polymerase-3 subunit delta